MDPRLIDLNPRIDDVVPAADHRSMRRLTDHRPVDTSVAAAVAGTRKHVGRWLVGLGTALEGGPAKRPVGVARR
jgi:hypothetical protein